MRRRLTVIAVSILFGIIPGSIAGQTTAFTFQGRLLHNTLPPTASYDFEFRLFDAESGGSDLGVVARPNVSVNSGVFSVMLDFGAQFDGAPRFLQIGLKPAGSPDPMLVLDPRQAISSSPYSIRSLNAASADAAVNAAQLGGVAAGQYVVTSDFRLSNERAPAPGSQNYIQNSAVVQSLAEFNIGGTGKAGSFDTLDGYQIEGQKVLDITGNTGTFLGLNAGINNTGAANTFAGAESGTANTTGFNNSYFGYRSGNANATGRDNSFFGFQTGFSNTGPQNSFFGSMAGQSNTTGNNNSFFGERAGQANSSGSGNSFVGARAGFLNTTGGANAFFGLAAGTENTTGLQNAFFGFQSGFHNVGGSMNVFVGWNAGFPNVSGMSNTFVGQSAGVGNTSGSHNLSLGSGSGFTQPGLTFATAIGPGTLVSTNNTIQLGRITQEERVLIPGDLQVNGTIIGNLPANSGNYIQNRSSPQTSSNFNISGTGTAATFSAGQYNIGNDRVLSAQSTSTFVGIASGSSGSFNSFFGYRSGEDNTTGSRNVFLGYLAGSGTTGGINNTFVGQSAGSQNITGSHNVALGSGSGFTQTGLTFATAIGPGTLVSTNNTIQLGRITGEERVVIPGPLSVGTTSEIDGVYISIPDQGSSFPPAKLSLGRCDGLPSVLLTNLANDPPCEGVGLIKVGNNFGLTSNPGGLVFVGGGLTVLPDQTASPTKINGGSLHLCYAPNPAPGGGTMDVFATCSSSIRYKTNVFDYSGGRTLLNRFRPVTFNWKNGGMLDLGLVAEEVAKIDPLLVTYNARGDVEGVKYDRIGVVLINVVKEQQRQIDELKGIICELKPDSNPCRQKE